jgi:AraC family transcriptional regulator, ethanolamine operon transcriptional activator
MDAGSVDRETPMSSGPFSIADRDEREGERPIANVPYRPIACTDPAELASEVADWNFEFTQLRPGDFLAKGGIVEFESALVTRLTYNQTLLQRGYSPRATVAVFVPGPGSNEGFLRGHKLEPGQCITMADGGCVDAITKERYVDISLAVDRSVWNAQSNWLTPCPLTTNNGTRMESVGQLWIHRMHATVDWIFAAIDQHPEALARPGVQASLRDQFLSAMADFGSAQQKAERRTRNARVRQRIAVQRAREYIRAKLSEPLRLSELCNYARVQSRSLEYGFREITGLSPIAYVKTVRLNAVRKVLSSSDASDRSISEIALDHGFWHLSQFSVDYRRFFGETPTTTRKRFQAMHSANHSLTLWPGIRSTEPPERSATKSS